MDLYFKTLLVFIHFALAAYCLVAVLTMDWKILQTYGKPLSVEMSNEIAGAKSTIPHALSALWGTGLLIVGYSAYVSPEYLANEKLWFKLFVVVILTLNGILVHRFGSVVRPGVVLAGLNDKTAFLLNMTGVISSVSWTWACFVGTARAWNGTLSFSTIMGFYLASLAAGITLAVVLHYRWKKRGTRVSA